MEQVGKDFASLKDRGRMCYYVPHTPNGGDVKGGNPAHFFCCIVLENEAGYYVTDWDWGADRALAASCAFDLNRERFGFTETEAAEIVLRSMARGKL